MFVLLLLVISIAGAIVLPPPQSVCNGLSRDSLLTCFSALLDGDQDGNVTAVEIDAFITTQSALGNSSCLPTNTLFTTFVNGTTIVSHCDLNSDGLLNVANDWNNATASCLTGNFTQRYICNLCLKCGWSGPIILRQQKKHKGSV